MNKIAVIMSVYKNDTVKYIKQAVDSIINQTVDDFTLYIYQDGPIPNDVDEFLTLISSCNVKIIRSNQNQGLAYALNNLIDIIVSNKSFDFIARMDSDDYSYPNRFERQLKYMIEHPDVDVLGCSCKEFGASYALNEKHLPEKHEELLNFSITRCPFIHPTVIFRSKIFEDGFRYPENTVLTEDMALWFKLLNSGYRFGNLNEVLLDYRLNENTINRRKGFKKAMSEIKIRTENMFSLNQFSLKNVFLISIRIVFHLLPESLLKLAYKIAR